MMNDGLEAGGTRPAGLLERVALWAAAAAIAAIGVLVSVNILLRWLFNLALPDVVLFVQQLMIPAVILPLAYVSARRGHIAVTIFTMKLGTRGQRVLDALGDLVGFIFIALLAWAAVENAWGAWQDGGYYDGDLRHPHWISRAVYLAGVLLFLCRLGWDVLLAVRRGPEALDAGAGKGE